MKKRIMYCTTNRDRAFVELPAEKVFRMPCWEVGMGAFARHLTTLGWENRRLGLLETMNPLTLRRHMMEFQPDVLYVYGATGEMPYWARRMCSWRGPIVHSWDDYYDEIWRHAFGRLAGLFMRYCEKRIMMHSDYIITLSYFLLERARLWGKKVWYIPNGCEDPPEPGPSKIKLEGDLKIVYSGSQSPYKRVHELTEAMQRLPKGIKLYLTGQPAPHLKRYASENVIFLGFLSREDLWTVMRQADILANTADQDCSMKYYNYIRIGKPILAYDGRANLIFKNRVNAMLTRDYAEAIMELYRSPELRQRLAENATRDIRVSTPLQWAQHIHQTLGIIMEDYARTSSS